MFFLADERFNQKQFFTEVLGKNKMKLHFFCVQDEKIRILVGFPKLTATGSIALSHSTGNYWALLIYFFGLKI